MKRGGDVISTRDRWRLGLLLSDTETYALAPQDVRIDLALRLEEAEAAAPETIDDDVVTMNSTVRLIDLNDQTYITRTLVYPEDVDLVPEGVSVLGALGSQLLGRQRGEVFECETGPDAGRWQVAEIVYQPERAGAFNR